MSAEYIPYPMPATDMPIDISFIFENEKPAGKHGFLKAQGDHFVFEDGTPGRFWGVCINASANFPEHSHAEKLAARLAKMGINIVRLHQLDAEYGTPNIFRFTKGPLLKDTRTLDPRSLDRLDYFIYCLKQQGIYIYMDLMVSRQFKTGDGVENADELYVKAQPASLYNRRMIDLQKEYATQLYTHVNPYTGLAYVDEPAIAVTDCINEGTLFVGKVPPEPYLTEFREGFRKWLAERGIDYDPEGKKLFGGIGDAPLIQYKIEMEKAFFGEIRDHLRQLGVKIPITGSNYIYHSGLFASNEDMDFRDNHAYFHFMFKPTGGTSWGERPEDKSMENFALTSRGDSGMAKLFHMRSLDKPFFVSEWNMTWPNAYRAEGTLMYAAMGALQGIDGICIHTYSYTTEQKDTHRLGKEIIADGVGGVPYREGVFSCWNDPAMMGLFYHAALILRRGDVAESKKRVAVVADPLRGYERAEWLKKAPKPLDWYLEARYDRMSPCYYGMGEVSKIGTCLEAPADADVVYTEPQWPIDMDAQEVRSDNGQMYRTWKNNYGWIDTERTKCVYGFLQKNREIKVDGMSVCADTDFGVIALSSLTDEGIESSDNMLLTTVGRAQNTGAEFLGNMMVRRGDVPVQVQVIEAEIRLKTKHKNLKVYSITPEGMHQGKLNTQYDEQTGELVFRVGQNWRSMYYLIQVN